MIFVSVGNSTQGFRRLLAAVDDLAHAQYFGTEPLLLQAGNTPYAPRAAQTVPFLPMETFSERIAAARLVITHGGCGTILEAVRAGKVPVVMPRRRKYGEHVNDHQLQLATALAAEGLVVVALEPGDLPRAIRDAEQRRPPKRADAHSQLVSLVAAALVRLHP